MGGSSKSAEKQAKAAADASRRQAEELQRQTELEKAKANKEREKAYRLLARSQRAAGGGFFESDSKTTLG